MTNDIGRIDPGDPDYNAVYTFWIQNDKPAYCKMKTGTYMKLETDGMITFVPIPYDDDTAYHTTSLGAIT